MVTGIVEADVESVALEWLVELDWRVAHGPEIAPDAAPLKRSDYTSVVLTASLRDALAWLNPDLLGEALDETVRRLMRPAGGVIGGPQPDVPWHAGERCDRAIP